MTAQHDERAELIRELDTEAKLLSELGYCGAPKLMRKAAALLAADAQAGGEAVATVLPGNGFLAEVPKGLPAGTKLYTHSYPQAVAQGWKWVPVEPTREMLNAAIDVDSFKLGDISPLGFRCSPQQLFEKCYAAMLSASPAAPASAQVAQPLTELLAAADDVCKTLEHPIHSVNAIQMWRLRDALTAHGIGKDQG